MSSIQEKFKKLGIDNAPGQEGMQKEKKLDLRGETLPGKEVNFSHGDVDAFIPIPGCYEAFKAGFEEGAAQAYTEYRGRKSIREELAEKIAAFTGAPVDPDSEIILTPGTQGALFLAMGALVGSGDKAAIVEPDYFANRKLVEFFDGELVPVPLDYMNIRDMAGLDLTRLEEVFKEGVKLFLFSNPNNPTGVIYSRDEILTIARLAKKYNVALIVDELYSRQIYENREYTHLRAGEEIPDNLITILGPSKMESLSGFRLGTAFGSADIITRMEKLQAIVSLRCAGYSQAAFHVWFSEPEGFVENRIEAHKEIRDDIVNLCQSVEGVSVRPTEGGSYLFITMPELDVSINDFVKIVRKLAGVTVTPGTEFGPQFTHSFRINFSQDHKAAVDAMKRLFTVMERYRTDRA